MANQARVPKFGNWEAAGEVPYTKYFNDARKGKNAGKMINPNDPEENPEAFAEDVPPVRANSITTGSDKHAPKPKEDRRTSKGDNDHRQRPVSPLHHDTMATKTSPLPQSRHGDQGDMNRRRTRTSAGSERSLEQSPLHPHQIKSSASPSRERKISTEGSNTPGRSKMNPGGRIDEQLEEGSVLPKFGDWDEGNPSTAEGYTHIFNKVREEKQTGAARVPLVKNESAFTNSHARNKNQNTAGCSCFGWLGK